MLTTLPSRNNLTICPVDLSHVPEVVGAQREIDRGFKFGSLPHTPTHIHTTNYFFPVAVLRSSISSLGSPRQKLMRAHIIILCSTSNRNFILAPLEASACCVRYDVQFRQSQGCFVGFFFFFLSCDYLASDNHPFWGETMDCRIYS